MSQYLLIISIGPVQEFIASARRSRDLWFGSWLLSELSKAAALSIVNQHQNDLSCLIFPAAENLGDLQEGSNFNVVNKIVALVEQEPSTFTQTIRQAMLSRLKEIRDEAYSHLPSNNYFLRKKANEQVEDLIEYFWAACPLIDPQDPKEYERVRKQAESLLAARKVTRDFKAVTWGDYVPKSSLDGLRESVIHEEVYNRVLEGKMTKEQLRRDYGVREGERLCGVGLLKRHGNRGNDDSFFSTSHVAALPLLQRLTDKKAVDKYVSTLTDELGLPSKELGKVPAWLHTPHPAFGRYDGHLLFEERLREFFETKELEKAKEALNAFLKTALGGQRPEPYYALLLADGDRMGKAIDEQKNVEEHRKLSSNLTQFAKSVRHIVEEEYRGSLVYSGGDDVLAFVPLHTILACARRLADEFQKQLAKFKVTEGGVEVSPTLSVGIAVAHHLEPLSDALELARNAEKIAKRVEGKNALAVTVSKRSGADCTVKGKWGELDKRLHRFAVLHRTDAVPDGAAYELRDLALRLEGLQDQDAMRLEAVRILQRKRAVHGKEEIAQKVLKELIEFIKPSDELIEAPQLSVNQLADELIVAREFASATEIAGITPEELEAKLPK